MQETLIKAKLSKMHSPLCTTLGSHSSSANTDSYTAPRQGYPASVLWCLCHTVLGVIAAPLKNSVFHQWPCEIKAFMWEREKMIQKKHDTNQDKNHQVTTPIAKGMISILSEMVNIHLSNGLILYKISIKNIICVVCPPGYLLNQDPKASIPPC